MDALVKIFDEFRSRIRSPIWGTIGLYVILLNWKAFYFLLFADVSVPEKFSFWDENVTHEWLIYYPLILGVISVVAVPWIRVAFTWVNKSADLKLHFIQSTQKTLKDTIDVEADTRLKQAVDAAEAVREQQKIDRAKRLQEAGEVGGEELINEIKEDREADEDREYPELSEIEKWIVHILCVRNLHGIQLGDLNRQMISQVENDQQLYVFDHKLNFLVVIQNRITPKQNLELRAGLQTLVDLNYLNKLNSTDDYWVVTLQLFDAWEKYVSDEKIEHPVWYTEETNNAINGPEA